MDDDDITGPPPLPPGLQQQFGQALSDVYRQTFDVFRASDLLSPSAKISQRTADRILLSVRDFLSSAQQADNARLSLQNSLPIELWCSVWRLLSFSDLVHATHVCREWRTAALNAPSLWQHVEFYTTRHYSMCDCTSCSRGSHAPGWDENHYPANATNVSYGDYEDLLARSRKLPLDLTVYVVPCHAAGDMRNLGAFLSMSHAHRLRGLTMFTADQDAPLDLLHELTALPRLTYLFVWELPVQGRRRIRIREDRHLLPQWFPRGLSAPMLDELGLASRMLVPKPDHELPSVRTLTVQPSSLDDDLRLALEACPNATRLTLDLAFSEPDSRRVPRAAAWWRARTASLTLRTVSATNVPESCAAWLRAALSPALPTVTLSYASTRPLSAGAILADLQSDIHLSVMVSPEDAGDFLVVRGTDRDARVRQVALPLDRALVVEDFACIVIPGLDFCWDKMIAVTAHATVWSLVASVMHVLDAGAKIGSLCIVVDAVGHQLGPQPPRQAPALPALRSLRLKIGSRALSIPSEEIGALVRGLRVPLPLAELEIDQQLIAGDATASAVRDLAGSVTLV